MTERIHSIDSVRAIAMLFIVAIHAEPFRGLGTYGNAANFAIDSTARFAVPFFFLTSGYLFARKLSRPHATDYVRTYLSRVTSIYGCGIVVYVPLVLLLTAGAAVRNGHDVSSRVLAFVVDATAPEELLYYGDSIAFHLWFLPALAISIGLVYAFVRLEKTQYLLPIAIVFHVVGLLGESYTMGVAVPFETRDALFFGLFYTALGYHIRTWEWSPSRDRSSWYLAATAAFAVIHLGERYVLGYVLTDETFHTGVYIPDYSLVTAFFAVSLFAFVLSRPTFGKTTVLPRLGSYAVAIYVLHPIVLYSLVGVAEAIELIGYDLGSAVLWQLALTPAAYVGSLGVYLLVTRAGIVRRVRNAAGSGSPRPHTS